jgi:SNF2 family DNA or RNA helicase
VNSLAIKIKQSARSHPSFQACNLPDIGLIAALKPFQIQGMLYAYAAKRCVIADATGLGKSAQCIGLINLINYKGGEDNRFLLVVPPSTIIQWSDEFAKFSKIIRPVMGIFGPEERVSNYVSGFQVMIISYQVLLRDWEMINDLGISNWIFDDAHHFRHHWTKTAGVVKQLTKNANRIVLTTATPMQKSPMDLHSLLEALGLNRVFGTAIGFENRYCVIKKTLRTLRDGRSFWKKEFVRARNLPELTDKVYPYVIQRTFNDVGEELPGLMVKPIWLYLSERQSQLQKQAHKKLVQLWDAGELATIRNKGFHYLRQLCAGTRSVGLKDDSSCKLDAIEQFISDKLGNEKVLIYSFYKDTVRALAERLRKRGDVDFEVITGDVTSKMERERIRNRFLTDPKLKVLIGTDAIKVGLNLQAARYLLCIDLILNAQELVQLIGRLRRMGATTKTVVVYFLLTKGTVEERLYHRLKYESALFDCVFNQKSDVFPELSAIELASLMGLTND